jgi:hypothetical protein
LIPACDVVRVTTNYDLAEQIEQLVRSHIEQLVRNHIETTRKVAAAAVERAFSATPAGDRAVVDAARQKPRAKAAPRRPVDEVLALAERFYAVLCRSPGETMATLAPQVGASPRALHVAVSRLKRAGRVRSVGLRQHTRYFPMTGASAVPAVAA